jgi:hypothetical protein
MRCGSLQSNAATALRRFSGRFEPGSFATRSRLGTAHRRASHPNAGWRAGLNSEEARFSGEGRANKLAAVTPDSRAPEHRAELATVSLRVGHRPTASELLDTPGALLTRSHLVELGLGRSAIDAVFRALPVIALPGTRRPMVRREDYLEFVAQCTYRDDRVRPILR